MNKRVLPNRLSIVISNSTKIEENENLKQAGSLEDALELTRSLLPQGKTFVIGGAQIFEKALSDCRYVYETLVAE